MENVNNNISASPDDSKLIKRDMWALEEPGESICSLEALLNKVNKDMARGRELRDILIRKRLSQIDPLTGQPIMTDELYQDYTFDFYATRTSKGYKPAIATRRMKSDLWDAIYLITRSPELFPGKASRLVSVVETCMLHIGLHQLDILLAGRSKIVQNRKNAIWKGGKYKRIRPKLPEYTFVNFTDTKDKQQNIWCLSPNDYARIAAIAEDYDLDMDFVTIITIIMGLACSERLPKELRINAIEETECFKAFVNRYL